MKSLKKLIAVVLAFALVFSAMAVGFAATPFTDVKDDAPYASAVARLAALNITNGVGDGKFGVDQPVTRAQMITFVNRMLGYEDLAEMAKSEKSAFKDVPQNHWAVGQINLAYKLGLAQGVGNGKFDPNSKLTYAQALAFVLRALGFKDLDWPYGYLAKAQDLGLAHGLNLAYNEVIKRGDLALVLDRALEVPMVKYVDGKEVLGEPLISKVATKAEYTVIATNAQDRSVEEGKVAVLDKDGKLTTINAGLVDFSKYLGKKVTVYSERFGDPVYVAEGDNDVVSFTEGQDSVGTTVYKNDDNKTAINVDDNAYVLYNGYLTKISEVIVKEGAEVTIINNNYLIVNGSYDAEAIVYNDVQSGDKYINRNSSFELKDPVTVTGAVSKVTDIKADDYIYYGKQYDVNGEVVGTVIYVVRNHVTGTVTEKSVSGSTYKVSIDTVSYTVSNGTVWDNLILGNKVTVILDKDNVIQGIASASETVEDNYAIFVEKSDPFTAWFAKVKLILPDASEKVFEAVYNDVYDKLPAVAGTIVTYTVNNDGKLNGITSAESKDFNGDYDAKAKVLKGTVNGQSVIFYLTDNTVLLNKTSDGYKALKLSDLTTTSDNALSAVVVVDEYNVAKAVVFDDAQFGGETSTIYAYVTGVATVYADGKQFTRLTVLENGVEKTYDATTTLTINKNTVVKLTLENGKVTAFDSATTVGNVKLSKIDQANLRIIDEAGHGYLLDPNFIVVDKDGNLKGLGDIKSDTVVNLYTNDVGKVFVIEIVQ